LFAKRVLFASKCKNTPFNFTNPVIRTIIVAERLRIAEIGIFYAQIIAISNSSGLLHSSDFYYAGGV